MLETNSTLPIEDYFPQSAAPDAGNSNGTKGSPVNKGASAPPAAGNVRQLAQKVGDDWKSQPYYDDAEQYIDQQWRESIWPFIREADFSNVVDLAAGHGRNSEKLKQHARKIHIIDINQENIDFCRKRFAGDSKFTFTRNDGCSLNFLPTGSISLLYCFDAMVHFDSDVVRAYLKEFKRILQPGAFGFCHHSNYTKNPGENVHDSPGWRNFMSQAMFAHYCVKEGLTVVKSKVIDWELPGSDCLTLFRQQGQPVVNGWTATASPEPLPKKKEVIVLKPEIFNSLNSTTPRTPIAVGPIEPAPIRKPVAAQENEPPPANSLPAIRQFYAEAAENFAEVLPQQLSEVHLRNSRILPSRDHILPLMPRNGICAEIGTQTGDFAKTILSAMHPAKLHVYDIDYTAFDQVRFAPFVEEGVVELHQGDSSTLLAEMPDRHFDFIYVDGDHSYEGIVKDLAQAARKIKHDGWIVCNDYTLYSPLEGTQYGVYRAVNELCIEQGFEVVYLGLHPFAYHDVALRRFKA